MGKFDNIRNEIADLLLEGQKLAVAWAKEYAPKALPPNLDKSILDSAVGVQIFDQYQRWYTRALPVVSKLIPSRKDDFTGFYEFKGTRKQIQYANYRIADGLRGCTFLGRDYDDLMGHCFRLLEQQRSILFSAYERLDSVLYDIEHIIQADLFDSELEAAKELNKKGFSRAAGAMVGVVLEKHLETVIKTHSISLGKKNPCINDYNQKLKDEGIVDIATWRYIQRLGDLRNLCDHNKGIEPKKEDIEELIAGVDKIMKTVA